jgi:hypothetical protein
MNRPLITLLCCALALTSSTGFAQTASRIRANVVSFDGKVLTVKTAVGKEIKVQVTEQTSISYPKAIKLADIKPGDFIGSAAMPGPEGKLIAREVHLFPEAQRGVGEGHNPWDLEPGSTMTNGGVSKSLKAANGQELTVQYKGGTKTILVPAGTPIVMSMPGERSLLVAGAFVFIGAQTAPDGTVTARYIQASKDGVKPPV